MKSKFSSQPFRSAIAILCAASLAPGSFLAFAQGVQEQVMTTESSPKIPNDQLDSLVAPIALYPDPLLSQTLVASTYPLEMIQLQQWLDRNKTLKDKALKDAVEKQNWDPSIQGMVAFPEVVGRLAGNIQWTTDLGNAFLAQQADVMDAVQRMRVKAQGTGNLKTGAQQKVETQVVDGGKKVIVIEQASPTVIYVPSYDPVIVYGAPVYPYPPYYYPGYVPGMGLAFGAGLALGIAWGGGWGYHCGWGGGSVNINYNNNYVNHYNNVNNINNINRGNGNNNWQHNPQHRGGAPYGDRGTADRFGGRTPGQQPGSGLNRPGNGNGPSTRPGNGIGSGNGPSTRPGNGIGSGNGPSTRPGNGIGSGNGPSTRPGNGIGSGNGPSTRPGNGVGSGNGPSTRPGSGVGSGNAPSTRPGSGGTTRPSTLPATTRPSGGDRIGNRSVSPGSNGSAFGGSRSSGSFERSSSARGASSLGGGGGGNRGGGGGGRR